MQIKHKILPAMVAMIGLGFFLGSCNKQVGVTIKQEGTVYMPQAFSTRSQLALTLVDSPQAVVFGAAYGGLSVPGQDINVSFKLDTTLIAAYNLKNGTSYVPFPASSYTLPTAMASAIKAGTTSSVPLLVKFVTSKLGLSKAYMLPITLSSISSGTLDSSLQTTYFSITKLLNIYDGSYHTTGTRTNFNADGSNAGVSTIDDTRVLSTLSADSSYINTIANLGAYNGTVFYVKVKSDNTCVFTGKLQNDPNVPVINQPGTTSTYNPATKVFTVHYMYTNTNGTIRKMDEVWTLD